MEKGRPFFFFHFFFSLFASLRDRGERGRAALLLAAVQITEAHTLFASPMTESSFES